MKIEKPHVMAVDLGDEEFNDAINTLQRTYESYMKEAWEKAPEDNGQEAAKRGMAFCAATGAFFRYLSHGAPESIRGVLHSMVRDIANAMVEQDRAMKKEPKA